MIRAQCSALPFVALLCSACGAPEDGEPAVTIIQETTTLITTESEMIAAATDMVVATGGDIFMLDAQLNHVLVVAPDGTIRRTIGREGSGPGELRGPAVLALDGDTLRVVDAGNGRIQLFSRDGEFLRTVPAPAATSAPLSLRSDGWIVAGTRGGDSTLAKYFDEHAVSQGSFGDPIVPSTMFWDFVAIKNEIATLLMLSSSTIGFGSCPTSRMKFPRAFSLWVPKVPWNTVSCSPTSVEQTSWPWIPFGAGYI